MLLLVGQVVDAHQGKSIFLLKHFGFSVNLAYIPSEFLLRGEGQDAQICAS